MPPPSLRASKRDVTPVQPPAGDGKSLFIVAPLAAITIVVLGALVLRCSGGTEPDATSSASASSAANSTPARCTAEAPNAEFVIGEASSKAAASPDSANSADPLGFEPDLDPLLAPYAVILGRATATETGFAVGVLADAEGGSVASVALISPDASTGKLVRLERARGDLDPPVVANAGNGVLATAMLQPNASSRAVKLAVIRNEAVTWGAEIDEGRDESLALDLAVSGGRGVVVWDAIEERRSYISLASFDVAEPGKLLASRRATPATIDADSPRVVRKPDGFYLVYLAHGTASRREDTRPRDTQAASPQPDKVDPEPAKSSKKPKKKAPKKSDTAAAPQSGEVDESIGGEGVSAAWLEVMPLDGTGAQSADALRITSADVTVVAFDVMTAPDGALLVAYRDDDAPTGTGGGPIRVLRVHAGGAGNPWESTDPLPADGTPTLMPGWLGVPSLGGFDLIARLGPDGLPIESPHPRGEASLGPGEPIAAMENRLLLAEPRGRAMKLRVVRCNETPASVTPVPSATPNEIE